jgi:hypothetical protein
MANKMGKMAKSFAEQIRRSEAKGLVHSTGGGGPMKWARKLGKAHAQLRASGEFVFIGGWEGGYIVTHAAVRRYGMQALKATYHLKEEMNRYLDPSSYEDGRTVSLAQLKKLAREVAALEKQPIIDDWDCDVEAYDPDEGDDVVEAMKDQHTPTLIQGWK